MPWSFLESGSEAGRGGGGLPETVLKAWCLRGAVSRDTRCSEHCFSCLSHQRASTTDDALSGRVDKMIHTKTASQPLSIYIPRLASAILMNRSSKMTEPRFAVISEIVFSLTR